MDIMYHRSFDPLDPTECLADTLHEFPLSTEVRVKIHGNGGELYRYILVGDDRGTVCKQPPREERTLEIWMRVGDYHHSGDHNVSPGIVLIRNVKKPNSDTIYKEVVRFTPLKG
jgi:hypothetical protein